MNKTTAQSNPTSIDELVTPCLLLDRNRMRRNIRRMSVRIGGLGGVLRPHVKTGKSIDVLQEIVAAGNTAGITVSTLHEADYFLRHGIADITYAVGIAPNKFGAAAELITRGADLKLILDSVEMASRLADYAARERVACKVLVELDTDDHRSGADPYGEDLLDVGRCLHESPYVDFTGVLTHAGASYSCRTPDALLAMARQERDRAVAAAGRLRAAGIPCPVVSIGSTPTALTVDDLAGVTEVRPGVYVFLDLVMAGLGVCSVDDIAVSVLASVTGFQERKNWAITDAGWMALSRDRGTADQDVDYGYGIVADRTGNPIADLIVSDANQEHGIVASRQAESAPQAEFELGDLVRILPNHACATAAQFDAYFVLDEQGLVCDRWERTGGW
jgi:D-serine deaminase-like pyridoxal phosphate-dependent protein